MAQLMAGQSFGGHPMAKRPKRLPDQVPEAIRFPVLSQDSASAIPTALRRPINLCTPSTIHHLEEERLQPKRRAGIPGGILRHAVDGGHAHVHLLSPRHARRNTLCAAGASVLDVCSGSVGAVGE
jgi:hypothetical protein